MPGPYDRPLTPCAFNPLRSTDAGCMGPEGRGKWARFFVPVWAEKGIPRTRCHPAKIPTLKPLTRTYAEVRLEY